jgi:hypothetical protein
LINIPISLPLPLPLPPSLHPLAEDEFEVCQQQVY